MLSADVDVELGTGSRCQCMTFASSETAFWSLGERLAGRVKASGVSKSTAARRASIVSTFEKAGMIGRLRGFLTSARCS